MRKSFCSLKIFESEWNDEEKLSTHTFDLTGMTLFFFLWQHAKCNYNLIKSIFTSKLIEKIKISIEAFIKVLLVILMSPFLKVDNQLKNFFILKRNGESFPL